MRQISEHKRSRITGKGGKALHLGIEHWIIDKPEFKGLLGTDVKMLVHLGRQYNGYNNGDFAITPIRGHWASRDTVQQSLKRLIAGGWIIKTRRGGLGMGCDLYAITWWPINSCKGKHDYPAETVACHLWMKKTPYRNPELAVPESGTRDGENCAKSDHVVPESGTRNPNFKAA